MTLLMKIAERVAGRLNDEEKARLQRAVEALGSGEMKVFAVSSGRWLVANGRGATYNVARTQDGWSCSCPDFTHRNVRCKHIFAAYLAQCAGLVQPASPNGHEPSEPEEASGAQPQPQPQPAQAEPQAAPTGEGLKDPEAVVVRWGKHKGKTLGQLAREAPGFIAWLAFKMEARSDEDRRLQEAARKVHDRLKPKAEKGEKKARGQSRSADPVAAFIAQAGIELLKEIWRAQGNGRDIEDPAIQRALELRVQAIRRVAELLRQMA